jgi:hypothetical protein
VPSPASPAVGPATAVSSGGRQRPNLSSRTSDRPARTKARSDSPAPRTRRPAPRPPQPAPKVSPDVDQIESLLIKLGHPLGASFDRRRGGVQPRRFECIAQEVEAPADPADERLVRVLFDVQLCQGLVHQPDRLPQLPASRGEDHPIVNEPGIGQPGLRHALIQELEIEPPHQRRERAAQRDSEAILSIQSAGRLHAGGVDGSSSGSDHMAGGGVPEWLRGGIPKPVSRLRASGRVASGGCGPEAPADPDVLAFEHSVRAQ